MKKALFPLIAVSILLAGCSKELSGRYVAYIPRAIPFESASFKLPESVRNGDQYTLEFAGSKVRISTIAGPSGGFPYRFDGKRVIVRMTSRDLVNDIPMIIQTDNSIAFGHGRYVKAD